MMVFLTSIMPIAGCYAVINIGRIATWCFISISCIWISDSLAFWIGWSTTTCHCLCCCNRCDSAASIPSTASKVCISSPSTRPFLSISVSLPFLGSKDALPFIHPRQKSSDSWGPQPFSGSNCWYLFRVLRCIWARRVSWISTVEAWIVYQCHYM